MIFWILLILVFVIYMWLTSDSDYYDKLGIPYEKPWPIVGNNLNILRQKESINDIMSRCYKKYKSSKVYGYFNFMSKMFIVTDPELIKKITIKDFNHFINHEDSLEMDDLLSRTLFALRDKKWRDMRTTLSPMFTSSKMKLMYGLLSDHSRDFIKFMEEQVQVGNNINVDVGDIFKRYTADGISTAALGFVGNSVRDENSQTCRMVQQLDNDFNGTLGALKFMLAIGFPKIYKFFNIQLVRKEVNEFFKRVVLDVMNEREKYNISRPDVIQLLLQARKGQLNHKINDTDVDKEWSNFSAHTELDVSLKNEKMSYFEDMDWVAQAFLFFGAGFDTSTMALQSLCYDLADHQDIQEELIAEVDKAREKFSDNLITYEPLHKMKFLDMVVSESLRLRPPAGITDRMCNKDYVLVLGNGRTVSIRKGNTIGIPIYQIHHDPEYYPNPESFNPYRFKDPSSIVSGTYLPFGMGARICIGSRFALMSIKLVLFNILCKFSIQKSEKTPQQLTYQPNFNFKYNETIYLNFIPRN
ncbi:cytochrome P450 9e2-like [Chironomus tepperi]|uniref:cytochrome P450 9e2-like n=1 Tax=Chironomus tepperi TaxID=113505 RepID=UPI00391F0621